MVRHAWLFVALATLGCAEGRRFELRDNTLEGAVDVRGDQPVVMELRGRVDATQAEVFWSTYGVNRRIPATIEAEDKRTLIITPLATPEAGTTQEVRVVGLLAPDGSEGESVVSFRTLRNPAVSLTLGPLDDNRGRACTIDDQGRYVECVEGLGTRSADGTYTNADLRGPEAEVHTYTYDGERVATIDVDRTVALGGPGVRTFDYGARDNVLRETFDLAGPDGAFGTDDDVREELVVRELDGLGFLQEEWTVDPGADGMGFTADDVLIEAIVHRPDPSGFDRGTTSIVGPGKDGLLRTADDRVSRFEHVETDELGRFVTRIEGFVGPDGLELTADDLWYALEGYLYGDDGRQVGGFLYDPERDIEADAWGDRFVYEDGRLARIEYFKGAGPDGTWLTDDDSEVVLYDRFTYDSDGLRMRAEYGVREGPDETLFTDDDVPSEVVTFGAPR